MNAARPSLPLDALVDSLDGARRRAMGMALRTRLSWVLAERTRRLGTQATVGAIVTFLLAALFPMTLVSVTPAVFGVPHVASDIRYLVLRRKLPSVWIRATLFFGGSLLALRAIEGITGLPLGRLEAGLATAWLLSAAWIGGRDRSGGLRRAALLAGVAAIGGLALAHPTASRVVFAHLHNVAALVVWVLLFRSKKKIALLPLGVAAAGAALLVSGVAVDHALAHPSLGMSLEKLAGVLAPGLENTRLGLGITLSYIYLQGVHYAVWLGWIPQEDVKGEGTITFRMSVKSALADFGPRGIRLIVIASIAMLAASAFDLQLSRSAYLSLATFHGYLELATLMLFASRGRASAPSRA